MDDRAIDTTPRRTPLAKRTPVQPGPALETESPEVVDRVASLLGKWAEDDAKG
jgi:hypothetical protein